jgi:hypothetical protein
MRKLLLVPTTLTLVMGSLLGIDGFSQSPILAVAPDEVLNWNAVASILVPAGGKNGPQQSRIYAMVQLAAHDALNAIQLRYEPYAYHEEEAPLASPAAAVATAARDVLMSEVPSQSAPISSNYATSLAAIPEGSAKEDGIAIGHAAAAAMLALRDADGSANANPPYTPGTLPGQWQPTPNPDPPNPLAPGLQPAAVPGWGLVQPFVLRASDQFRPDGPPALDSAAYSADYQEVKVVGEQNSPVRTAEESAIARFWYEPAPAGWSRIARVVSIQQQLDQWQEARLLALLNSAMADGFITSFNAKYRFNFWRPVTAIRAGDIDGNSETLGDLAWNTYLNTPAIPDYPSTHSVLGAAVAEILGRFFGRDEVSFTTTSGAPFAGLSRSFTSFSQAARENADSRVLAGIHFRSACRDGLTMGRKVGKFVFMHAMGPVRQE